jgi:hypothetical protein
VKIEICIILESENDKYFEKTEQLFCERGVIYKFNDLDGANETEARWLALAVARHQLILLFP